VAGYSGDAGDAMAAAAEDPWWISNGQKFSTPDSDNDISVNHCAKKSGWWYGSCSAGNVYRPDAGIWSTTDSPVADVQASRMLVKLN